MNKPEKHLYIFPYKGAQDTSKLQQYQQNNSIVS